MKKIKKKIIFFGGSSFASQDLINKLKKNYELTNLSRKKVKGIDNIKFDINNFEKHSIAKKISNRSDYVFFFTSYVPLKENKPCLTKCFNTNIFSLVSLLFHIKEKPKKIILASSISLYGKSTLKILNEDSPVYPSSHYSISKYIQENILRIFCNRNKIKFLSLRLGYVYGKNLSHKRIIKKLFLNIKNKKKFKVYNQNKFKFQLIHTRDISNIIIKIFKKAEGTFNLINKDQTTIKDLIKVISKKVDMKAKYKNYNKPEKDKNYYYSSKKLLKKFNIKTNINLEDDISDLL